MSVLLLHTQPSSLDGVVKTLHLVRCYIFSIITTYLMYAEIIEKMHASNMKLFTYPSNIKVSDKNLQHGRLGFLRRHPRNIFSVIRQKIARDVLRPCTFHVLYHEWHQD